MASGLQCFNGKSVQLVQLSTFGKSRGPGREEEDAVGE